MTKKYSVIYADPPWQQKQGRKLNGYKVVDGKQVFNSVDDKAQDLPYKTMTFADICNLDVESIAADDCFLFMWVTNKYLLDAKEVLKAWGFKYSTTITWCKQTMGGGLGGDFGINCEYLIFARRGKPKATKKIKSTWFNIKREYENGYPCSSRKPHFFRELIESMTAGDKVELFARKRFDRWDAFGNEVDGSIHIGVKP